MKRKFIDLDKKFFEENDIEKCKEKRIRIIKISCTKSNTSDKDELYRSIMNWSENENALLYTEKEVERYTICGEKGRVYHTTYYFSTFSLYRSSDDGYLEDLDFISTSENSMEILKSYPNFDETKSPSIWNILYGLIRKYPKLKLSISASIEEDIPF